MRRKTVRESPIYSSLTVSLLSESREILRVPVMADDLLEDLFVILYSDPICHTPSGEVMIVTSICEDYASGYWRVSITDKAKGVAEVGSKFKRNDELSPITREGALGVSILRALITDRYHGRLHFEYRIPASTVTVWLPNPRPSNKKNTNAGKLLNESKPSVVAKRSKFTVEMIPRKRS